MSSKDSSPERKRRVKPVTDVPGCYFLRLIFSETGNNCRLFKALPETHEKLKEKHEKLQEDFKALKSENKGQKLNDAERQKFLTQFEKLG